MIGVPDKKAQAPAPESISILAAERTHAVRAFSLALACLVVTAIALFGWFRAEARFANEARISYVKLAPNGSWTVAHDLTEHIEYYDATLRAVLYDWVERRFSMRSDTILSDWGIANAMYAPSLRDWFTREFQATAKATEHAQCVNCPQRHVSVRTHQHVDPLPENPGIEDSAPVRTLLYATEQELPLGSLKPIAEKQQIYRVTWRLLAKRAIQTRPDLLRYNPIGVEILEVEVTDDPS